MGLLAKIAHCHNKEISCTVSSLPAGKTRNEQHTMAAAEKLSKSSASSWQEVSDADYVMQQCLQITVAMVLMIKTQSDYILLYFFCFIKIGNALSQSTERHHGWTQVNDLPSKLPDPAIDGQETVENPSNISSKHN